MTEHLKIANTDVPERRIGDWADTETSVDIRRSLELVKAARRPSMTMIAGVPGSGKTTTLIDFCHEHDGDVIYLPVAKAEGTAWNFAQRLALRFTNDPRGAFQSLAEARMRFDWWLKGRMLLVDEAQYLNQKNRKTGDVGEVYEWLRAASEEVGFHVVFCGDLALTAPIESMPQLQSRMLRPIIIRHVSRADVAAITAGTPFATPQAIDILHKLAQMRGGLRNVERVADMAAFYAGDDTPDMGHLKVAVHEMKLATKGVF